MTARRRTRSIHAEAGQLPLFDVPAVAPADLVDAAVVAAAELVLDSSVSVLPRTELSGLRGYPVVRWSSTVAERMSSGAGPMLDAQVLELWEMCPAEGAGGGPGGPGGAGGGGGPAGGGGAGWGGPAAGAGAPPAAPLSIVGFVATGQWKRALYVASELRGFGETVVLTERRPTALSLTAADLADVSVVHTSHAGEELLVRGSKVADPPRIVAVRYWEERLFAHALATGVPITPQPAPA